MIYMEMVFDSTTTFSAVSRSGARSSEPVFDRRDMTKAPTATPTRTKPATLEIAMDASDFLGLAPFKDEATQRVLPLTKELVVEAPVFAFTLDWLSRRFRLPPFLPPGRHAMT